MAEMHLRFKPGFTYSACRPFNKNKEKNQKHKKLEIHIHLSKRSR